MSTGPDGKGNTLIFSVSQCGQRNGRRVLVPSATRPLTLIGDNIGKQSVQRPDHAFGIKHEIDAAICRGFPDHLLCFSLARQGTVIYSFGDQLIKRQS